MLFEMAGWMTQLHDWARSLPKPKAILIVSAHWESAPLSISSSEPRELVYDFGGFAPMYYEMRYDTPDGHRPVALGRLADAGRGAGARAGGAAAWTTAPGCP